MNEGPYISYLNYLLNLCNISMKEMLPPFYVKEPLQSRNFTSRYIKLCFFDVLFICIGPHNIFVMKAVILSFIPALSRSPSRLVLNNPMEKVNLYELYQVDSSAIDTVPFVNYVSNSYYFSLHQQSKYKVINKDQWCNVLEFSRTISLDLSNYDEDGACKYQRWVSSPSSRRCTPARPPQLSCLFFSSRARFVGRVCGVV